MGTWYLLYDGSSPDGRGFAKYITRTIDKERDANVQIEGRELFCDFVDEITKLMKAQKHRVNPKPVDDYT